MSDIEQFRQETRAWLEENCPQEMRSPARTIDDLTYGGSKTPPPSEAAALWLKRMADKGWTCPTWPEKYGGAGLDAEQARVLKKELKRINAREPINGHGVWMLGPALLEFGNEEQKLEHLPPIARGERRWCQGYSEPGAGSDLASLRCKAEDKGDHFLLNGQKCWTTDGHHADWIFMLVRTDPTASKHEGISFLLADMATEGIEAIPVTLINGNQDFCDTFLTNVKVPKKNLIGELNGGWAVAKGLLGHERSMMARMQDFIPPMPRTLEQYALDFVGLDDEGKLRNRDYREKLVQHRMNQKAMQLSQARAFEEGMAGVIDMTSVSYFKGMTTEEDKRGHELQLALTGYRGLGWGGEEFNEEEFRIQEQFLASKVYSMGGGTTEIQWNVVAKKLGLPQG